MSKRFLIFMLLLSLILIIGAEGTSKKASYFGYVSKDNNATLIADVETTRLRTKDAFMPLRVWFGHTQKRVINLERSSFTLTDPSGKTYNLAAIKDVMEKYGSTKVNFDSSYKYAQGDYASLYFANYTHIPVKFFPAPASSGVKYDHVELAVFTYFGDTLYFPIGGSRDGTFKLTLTDSKTKDSWSVSFEVPWMK